MLSECRLTTGLLPFAGIAARRRRMIEIAAGRLQRVGLAFLC
jgi:hypothetical protein